MMPREPILWTRPAPWCDVRRRPSLDHHPFPHHPCRLPPATYVGKNMKAIAKHPKAILGTLLAFLLALAMLPAMAAGAPDATASEATGKNVALGSEGGTATGSGQEVPNKWGPNQVNDGVPAGDSRWSSDYSDTAWVQVKLASAQKLDHINLVWEAACAAQFKIQVSNDGSAWTDATDTLAGNCAGTNVVSLKDAPASQYVRMQASKRTQVNGKFWGISLYEMEIWNGAEPLPPVPVKELGLIPLPANFTENEGPGFTLKPESRIVADAAYEPIASLYAPLFRASTGYELPVVTGTAGPADIALRKTAGAGGSSPEAYTLAAGPDGLRIDAGEPHGAFNAIQTLRQLFPGHIESAVVVRADWSTPSVTISDSPRLGYRGIMFDVARSFQTVEEAKKVIDTLAAYKINAMHLHLSDDQGWRIEITNDNKAAGDTIDYSLLTSVSGKTAMTEWGYQNEMGRTGFYTQAQYTELVNYAAERFVQIIPEIDLPGHTNAALHAIPELNTAGSSHAGTPAQPTAPHNGTGAVGYSYLDPNSEVSFTFIKHVLGQLAELTPGGMIHVGGDESHAMVSRYGQPVFNSFVERVLDITHDLGAKANGWNEISRVESIQAGDFVQYWTGETNSLTVAAAAGAKVVMSRGSTGYVDMKYNPKTPIGLQWACRATFSVPCDFPQYYNWDPATIVPGIGDAQLAGVEPPMWSETIRGVEQAQFMMFPRALAFAEMGWTPQAKRNVMDFTSRLGNTGGHLTASGANYYDSALATWFAEMAGTDNTAMEGESGTFDVARLLAPGTEVTGAGAGVTADRNDDDNGVSTSELKDFGATINWGDGSEETAAVFRADRPRTSLRSSGEYILSGDHSYAKAGVFTGTVTGTDGRTATFQVTVKGLPVAALELESTTVQPGSVIKVGGTDFGAGESISITLGATGEGIVARAAAAETTAVAGEDGTFEAEITVPADTPAGVLALTASGEESGRSATVEITVTALTEPTATATPSPSATPTASATATTSPSATTTPAGAATTAAATTPASDADGLASTGNTAGGLLAAAALLMGMGGVFMLRRRKSGHS